MRSLSSSTPNTLASWPRTVCVFCVGQYSVKRPLAASYCAASERGSSGLAVTRLLTTLSLTTCAAAANAAAHFSRSPMR